MGVAENLAQEVMLTVHQRACRHFAKRMREGPTVDLADMGDRCADPSHNAAAPQSFEFRDWMAFLEPQEREVMRLRFVEEWEYPEIAAAKAIPTGAVQWRVFNSKKKLATHLSPRRDLARKAA